MEENKSVYYLSVIKNRAAAEKEISNIKGVLSASIDEEQKTLTFFIDDWTSEYDVFTKIVSICDAYGCEFDFGKEEKEKSDAESSLKEKEEKTDRPAKKDKDLKKSKKAEKVRADEESEDAEDLDEDDDEYDNDVEYFFEDDDYKGELDEDGGESYEQSEGKKKKKKRSDIFERAIELGVAAILFIVGLFLKDRLQLGVMACAFAIAGYEVMYEAVVKIVKKQFISEQLLLSITFLCAVFLGYVTYAVAAVLLYAITSYAIKVFENIKKKNSPVYEVPENCRKVENKKNYRNVAPQSVVLGDVIYFKANEFCLFDGTVKNDCTVTDFFGRERELKQNDKIYAGEKALGNVFVVVEKTLNQGKFDNRNAKILAAINEKSGISAFLTKNKIKIIICLFALGVLIAFLPPVFYDDYVSALNDWGYRAVMLVSLGSFAMLIGSHDFASVFGAIASKKLGVIPFGSSLSKRAAKATQCYFDEAVLLDNDSKPLKDAHGAIMELKDSDVKSVLVSKKSESECMELCKELKIPEFYAEKTDETDKASVFTSALNGGDLCVMTDSLAKNCDVENDGALICFNRDNTYTGDSVIDENEISLVPFTVKLAKRTVKLNKIATVLSLSVKAVAAILALSGIAQLWWIVLADSLAGLISLGISYLNSKEVY